MTNKKKQMKLEKGDILANISYSQEDWNNLSESIPVKRLFSWKGALIGLLPLIAWSLFSNIFNSNSTSTAVESNNHFYVSLPVVLILSFVTFLSVLSLLRWFQLWYWPRPKTGKSPKFILARNGIKINGKYYFWDDPAFTLMEAKREGNFLYLDIAWGFGIGNGVIPLDKVPPQEQEALVNNLNEFANTLRGKVN